MSLFSDPFPQDTERSEIWRMLVERDIEAFVAADWSLIQEDFIVEGFHGVDARGSDLPDSWRLSFPDLASYRRAWLEQAREMASRTTEVALRRGLVEATTLRDIEVNGDSALAHKKFDGWVETRDGSRERLAWQTLYRCRRTAGRWRIAGFVGYLPNPMGQRSSPALQERGAKAVPEGATQHVTAGPYSPVLRVRGSELVVISGQAAIAHDGSVPSQDFTSQSRLTLENCQRQLASAGCELADVFKVNVYLADLADWPAFNVVYEEMVPAPRPVRTAVQAGLLPGLRVEVEMWAALP